MKSEDIEWKSIRGALVVFIITIALSSTLVFGANYFKQQMQLEFNRTNASFRSISDRYLAVDEEEKLIRQYLPEFVALYNTGIIGDEQRLNWVEVLRDIGDEINVPNLNYRIETQQVFTPAYKLTMGKFKLYSSKMILTMQLLHEGDIFRIIEKLENEAKGVFSLTSCGIQPTSTFNFDDSSGANVTAQCELEWYTIKLASGSPIEV